MSFPVSFFSGVYGGVARRAAMILLAVALTGFVTMAPAKAPAGTGTVAAPLRAQLASASLAACRCQQRAERDGTGDASPCWREFWAATRPLELSNLRPTRGAIAAPASICVEDKAGPWCLTLRWQTAYGVLCTAEEARAVESAMSRAPAGGAMEAERRAVQSIREGASGAPGAGA